MRFDPTKALESVALLGAPRFAGVEGVAQLSEFALERFASLSWRVESSDVRSNSAPTPLLIARRGVENPGLPRVLLVTPLRGSTSGDRPRALGEIIKSLRASGHRFGSVDSLNGPAGIAGLALLLELARSWPRSWNQRVDLVLISVGGAPRSVEAMQTIAGEFDPVVTRVPTLLLSVFGPGVGRELIVAGETRRELVLECARSLWIPVSAARSSSLSRSLWPRSTIRAFPDHVALVGSGLSAEEPSGPDGPAMQRAAQLIAEVALRWSKEVSLRGDQRAETGDSRSDSRSSQKPG